MTKDLINAADDMLIAFAEGVEWTDEKRKAYTALFEAHSYAVLKRREALAELTRLGEEIGI